MRDKRLHPAVRFGRVTPVETRGGLTDVEQIRVQMRLPETADELCAVARDLNADAADIRLGKGASEHDVKLHRPSTSSRA